MTTLRELVLGELWGTLFAVLAICSGSWLLFLGAVGLLRREVASLMSYVIVERVRALNAVGSDATGLERKKRLFRLMSIAGLANSEMWESLVRELALADSELASPSAPTVLEKQILCDAVGRELEARLAKGNASQAQSLRLAISSLFVRFGAGVIEKKLDVSGQDTPLPERVDDAGRGSGDDTLG